MRRAVVAAVVALAGCAGGIGAPGPGGAGVIRVRGPGAVVEPGCVGWCRVSLRDGVIRRDGPGLKVTFGARIGVVHGALGARGAVLGLAGEPHLDVGWVPVSDRWALTASLGYVFQTLPYGDDTVAYRGVAPSLRAAWGLRRRLAVHAGVGAARGAITVTPDADAPAMTAAASQARALAGATLVLRRTPSIDLALRVEASAFASGQVAVGGERGRLAGWGVTSQLVVSSF
ncbi:MAG: hypothetical protein IPL61_16595 [Myxococcales bacterium]|nr:hypothetical protein [Myxococcales bacterium]